MRSEQTSEGRAGDPSRPELTRRQVLRRSAMVGGALVWAVPAVQSLPATALAATGSDRPRQDTSPPQREPAPPPRRLTREEQREVMRRLARNRRR